GYKGAGVGKRVDFRGCPILKKKKKNNETQGKTESCNQTRTNRILLENYYLPGDLEAQIEVFVFQEEDGIRDSSVTGVQTCALPIWRIHALAFRLLKRREELWKAVVQK